MSFSFLDFDEAILTAADATSVTGVDMGGVFYEQTKQVEFKLGNTGSSAADFTCTVSGVNASILDDVELSLNGTEWYNTVTVSGVQPNAVTDIIRCRYTPPEGEIIGDGSFLILVTE